MVDLTWQSLVRLQISEKWSINDFLMKNLLSFDGTFFLKQKKTANQSPGKVCKIKKNAFSVMSLLFLIRFSCIFGHSDVK